MDVIYDQHFLINSKVILKLSELLNSIFQDCEITTISNSSILEIGGGKGVLTQEIIKKNPKKFTCLEIDITMSEYLVPLFNYLPNELHSELPNKSPYSLHITNAIDFLSHLEVHSFDCIIGNIPYGITQALYTQLYFLTPQRALFLQSHKTTRTLIEKNTTKQSQLIRALYSITCEEIVEGSSFEPIAKTKSSIVVLKLKSSEKRTKKESFLVELTKRYNQTFSNACIYSLAHCLNVGKKEIKQKLQENDVEVSNTKINIISNEEFNVTIGKIEEIFFNE